MLFLVRLRPVDKCVDNFGREGLWIKCGYVEKLWITCG
jgi:hypothetical protein